MNRLTLVSLVAVAAVTAWPVAGPVAAAGAPPPAPATTGITLDGKRLSLADLRGRPVLVNVWSSW